MTCKNCLYYEVCPLGLAIKGKTGTCLKFKNKADFVEVVRCKDCKYCLDAITGGMWCEHPDNIMPLGSNPNDFCSYGERKEE